MNPINGIGGLLFLASLTIEDIREQKISFYKIFIAGILAFFYQGFANPLFLRQLLVIISPGILMLLISFISKENLGYGDGLAVIVLGLWTGWIFTLLTVCTGIILSSGYSLVYLLQHRRNTIPFIPFLLLGMEVTLLYV